MKNRFKVLLNLTPAIISLLLIGAHFLRSGNFLVSILSLILIMALCVREPLVARTAQITLLLATAEWIHVAFTLVPVRMESGLPWTKLVIILGSVAALSVVSVFLFYSKSLKEMYHLSFSPDDNLLPQPEEHKSVPTGPSRPEQPLAAEHQQLLLAAHHLKVNITTASLLAFLLMDYSTLLGMVTLIAIALTNISLRGKMQSIGGRLPLDNRKKLYTRQTIGLCLLSVPIIGYYSFLLPAIKLPIIVGSIITVYTFILWAAARYEYLSNGNNS